MMCRLFGLHAGATAVKATFWLLDAPDSLAAQSHRNPDGTGIGVFGADGRPAVDKQPMAAWDDAAFASAARELSGTTFVAHVRHASTGALTSANTHPFEQDGRLFAHNGVVEGLETLDRRLAELQLADLVHGDTDSERMFALVTGEIVRHGGDVRAGITASLEWIATHLPIYSVNFILITPTDLWALRYPDPNQLWLLRRTPTDTTRTLDARTDRIHARSHDLAHRPSVILASEPMDDDPRWRELNSGELLHVAADLTIDTQDLFSTPPAHQLLVTDLAPDVASTQQTTP
jgi:predicted glutamine amidotransferase